MSIFQKLLGWFTDYQPEDNEHKAKLNDLYYQAGWNACQETLLNKLDSEIAKGGNKKSLRYFKQHSPKLRSHLKTLAKLQAKRAGVNTTVLIESKITPRKRESAKLEYSKNVSIH